MSSENREPSETSHDIRAKRPVAGSTHRTTLRRPSWLMRLWLSCVAQYLFLIGFSGIVGFTYFASHHYWNDEYWCSISKIVNSCLGVYQIGPDSTGRRIELQYAGQPVTNVAALPPAPFGIEKIAGIQAVLNRYAVLARSTDLVYAQNESGFLGAFSAGERGLWILRASWFPGLSDSRAEFCVEGSDMARLRALKGPELQHFASSFLLGARIFDPRESIETQPTTPKPAPASPPAPASGATTGEKAPATPPAVIPAGNPGPGPQASTSSNVAPAAPVPSTPAPVTATPPTIKDVHDYIDQRISAAFAENDLQHESVQGFYQPGTLRELSGAERKAVADYFADWDRRVVRQLGVTVSPNEPADLPKAMALANKNLTEELTTIVRAETSSFWLMGRWRWLEMIWWVWFGILTQALVQHGLRLIGITEGLIWQPGEMLRTFAKLFYAPLLALALFFLAEFIGSAKEAVEFSRNSPATLGICLILGLFPNTAYRIIKEVSTTVFRSNLTTSSPPKAAPSTTVATIDVTHKTVGGVYHLDRLKENVAAHITAPLQPEKK